MPQIGTGELEKAAYEHYSFPATPACCSCVLLQEPAVPSEHPAAGALLVAGTSLPRRHVPPSLSTNLTPNHLNHAVPHPQLFSARLSPPYSSPRPPHTEEPPSGSARAPNQNGAARLLCLRCSDGGRARLPAACGARGLRGGKGAGRDTSLYRPLISVLLQPDFLLRSERGKACSHCSHCS